MTQTINYPLSSTFSGVSDLQANGIEASGNASPTGISGSLDIVDGVMRATLAANAPLTLSGHRSEIAASAVAASGECWYTFQFMIPSSGWNDSYKMTVMQLHDTPNNGNNNARFPNFVLLATYGSFELLVPSATLPTEANTYTRKNIIPIIKDHWYTGCFHNNLQTTTAGLREFFLDRQCVYREYGVSTSYGDTVGPYLKLGMYDIFSSGYNTNYVAYYANAGGWTGNDGYETVLAAAAAHTSDGTIYSNDSIPGIISNTPLPPRQYLGY